MIIRQLKYQICSSEFNRPVITQKLITNHKSCIFVKIETQEGKNSIGECSPLPNFSIDTIPQAENEIKALQEKIGSGLIVDMEAYLKGITHIPSLRFSLEQAIHKPDTDNSMRIPVNEMIGISSVNKTLERINSAVDKGILTIKLKLDANSFLNEIERIKVIRNDFPQINIRLDLNGLWSFRQAQKYIPLLSEFGIEYVEQPVADIDDLIELSKLSNIQIAADESVKTYDDAVKFLDDSEIKHLVIKPMTIGFRESLKIIEHANEIKKFVIVSSLFETNIGRNALLYLASKTKHNLAHGLAVYSKIGNALIDNLFEIRGGFIEHNYTNSINDILTEINFGE